jgi:hypothetical protein
MSIGPYGFISLVFDTEGKMIGLALDAIRGSKYSPKKMVALLVESEQSFFVNTLSAKADSFFEHPSLLTS